MAKHYVDFVGLNTFIYEPNGWDTSQFPTTFTLPYEEISWPVGDNKMSVSQNFIGGRFVIDLKYKKNYLFSHELPNTASFFPTLMLKRNGPYGFPTWKQIRVSENPLSRKQRKENVFTFVDSPGPDQKFEIGGRTDTFRAKYGNIKLYIENPVITSPKPFSVGGASLTPDGLIERFEMVSTFANEAVFFNNEELNEILDKKLERSKQYENITKFYLNGGLDNDNSPLDSFEYFRYRETVFPPRIYTFKKYNRQRTTFVFPWRDNRSDRKQIVIDNGFGSLVTQSVWPLDAYTDWETAVRKSFGTRYGDLYGYDENDSSVSDYGILQNQYSFASSRLYASVFSGYGFINDIYRIGPQYNRKHTLTPSASVVSPNGMPIEGIDFGSTLGDLNADFDTPSGEAKWEAASQSGLAPFYDTYDDYIQGLRQKGKDYSIIPEFRISDHVDEYQSKSSTEEVSDLFSLTGALSNTDDSSKSDFYKIYSTSEFLKHFDIIKKDHDEFVDPSSISLKCKAIKKFIPYDGFYPAQRSVDLAKQFYSSYSASVSAKMAANVFGDSNQEPVLFQNLMVPMFAPGIFFNSIKAGVACDYPLISSNVSEVATNNVLKSSNDYMLTSNGVSSTLFDKRIPFEAVVEPEKSLAGVRIYCNEPHIHANNSGSVIWDGTGNNLYKLMAHNFTAEVPNFFLKDNSFTTIVSKPSSDPDFGNAEAGKAYMMRIKMYKSKNVASTPVQTNAGGFIDTPQYAENTSETFTMYSRPTAFGPPSKPVHSSGPGNEPEKGENYPFTPPYYYGQAFCDITFRPPTTKKYTLNEIIENSTVEQWRYAGDIDTATSKKTQLINGDAMRLSASVNIFSKLDFIQEKENRGDTIVLPNSTDNPARWAIQTKFETPMLNFNHLSASNSITLPNNAPQSVPRGMWHQYGRIEEDAKKGIFLQVDDVPTDWISNWLGGNLTLTSSLTDLCGFSTEPTKLGQLADTKVISEAVVAVPFVEREGDRKFFTLSKNDIDNAQASTEDKKLVGDSVIDMVEKMKRYVFPPPMDFVRNTSLQPFAMYIFEFSHTLDKQDLANIWQNLYPKIGRRFDEVEATITHDLLAHELLGGGAVTKKETGTLDKNAMGKDIPTDIRWMVFKVKQRAEINYYNKIIGRSDTLSEASVNSEGAVVDISYNWPYDFFSLVELVKLDAEVTFAEREILEDEKPQNVIKPKISVNLNEKIQVSNERLKSEILNTPTKVQPNPIMKSLKKK